MTKTELEKAELEYIESKKTKTNLEEYSIQSALYDKELSLCLRKYDCDGCAYYMACPRKVDDRWCSKEFCEELIKLPKPNEPNDYETETLIKVIKEYLESKEPKKFKDQYNILKAFNEKELSNRWLFDCKGCTYMKVCPKTEDGRCCSKEFCQEIIDSDFQYDNSILPRDNLKRYLEEQKQNTKIKSDKDNESIKGYIWNKNNEFNEISKEEKNMTIHTNEPSLIQSETKGTGVVIYTGILNPKICNVCKIEEYQEDALFCRKCGTPYNKMNERDLIKSEIEILKDAVKNAKTNSEKKEKEKTEFINNWAKDFEFDFDYKIKELIQLSKKDKYRKYNLTYINNQMYLSEINGFKYYNDLKDLDWFKEHADELKIAILKKLYEKETGEKWDKKVI